MTRRWTRFRATHPVALLLAVGCAPERAAPPPVAPVEPASNRLAVPPDVVNNLGLTFVAASRGRLGVWRDVSGELVVPESHRWELRAPARGRVDAILGRWEPVRAGEEVVRLSSPAVQELQREVEAAQGMLEQARVEAEAARARLLDSEAVLARTAELEAAVQRRLAALEALRAEGNALTDREILDVRETATRVARGRLEAAVARDEMASRAAERQLAADQAERRWDEHLREFAVLTGTPIGELRRESGGVAAWREIDALIVRAPADGVVHEIATAQGELVAAGDPLVRVLDATMLRFRGRVPEGDAGAFAGDQLVRLEFPSRELESIETRLAPVLPVADATTRMLHVEAPVPNPDARLAHGMSAIAHVRIELSPHEEVLIPERCVVFDGLEAVVFKRAPEDPNVVIRTPVELGRRDAGRSEVLAGVLAGDELVADGVRQLERSGLGKAPEGGHFHADGTWHSDHE